MNQDTRKAVEIETQASEWYLINFLAIVHADDRLTTHWMYASKNNRLMAVEMTDGEIKGVYVDSLANMKYRTSNDLTQSRWSTLEDRITHAPFNPCMIINSYTQHLGSAYRLGGIGFMDQEGIQQRLGVATVWQISFDRKGGYDPRLVYVDTVSGAIIADIGIDEPIPYINH